MFGAWTVDVDGSGDLVYWSESGMAALDDEAPSLDLRICEGRRYFECAPGGTPGSSSLVIHAPAGRVANSASSDQLILVAVPGGAVDELLVDRQFRAVDGLCQPDPELFFGTRHDEPLRVVAPEELGPATWRRVRGGDAPI